MNGSDVESRLAAVERSLRRWRLAGVGMFALLIVGVGVAAQAVKERPASAGPEALRAGGFILVNDEGDPVGYIGQISHGWPNQMELKGRDGAMFSIAPNVGIKYVDTNNKTHWWPERETE